MDAQSWNAISLFVFISKCMAGNILSKSYWTNSRILNTAKTLFDVTGGCARAKSLQVLQQAELMAWYGHPL
jgi:hypothetical protein